MSGGPLLQVLVVDDNRSAAEAIALLLQREGHSVEVRFDGRSAIELLSERSRGDAGFDLVLTDLRMEPIDGLGVVRAARRLDPPVEVMVFTAYGSVEAAVEAIRLGALDFLTKPVTADQLLRRVRSLHKEAPPSGEIIGNSEATRQLRNDAARLAEVRSTVLVTGETGSGRTHLAQWLHANGLDAALPLRTVRAGETPSLESVRASGTLLLPAVDDWDDTMQVTILRLLEQLDVGQPPRIIATASPEVEARAAEGRIRPELYFRLAVLIVRITPLRERPNDLVPLLHQFIHQHARVFNKDPVFPDPEQLASLRAHAWPGNAREISNLAERAVVLGAQAYTMSIKPLSPVDTSMPPLAEGFQLAAHLEETERTLLLRAIDQTGGDRPEMCRLLGLERNTLRYKLNKYGLLDRLS